MARNDFSIKEEIIELLDRDGRVASEHIEVDVQDGVVRLSGMVPTSLSLERAVKDTWAVKGVSEVKDELKIMSYGEVSQT